MLRCFAGKAGIIDCKQANGDDEGAASADYEPDSTPLRSITFVEHRKLFSGKVVVGVVELPERVVALTADGKHTVLTTEPSPAARRAMVRSNSRAVRQSGPS